MILLEHRQQAASAGYDAPDAVAELDETLDAPLPTELTREEMERAERDRVARENEAARERLTGIMTMPRGRS